MSDFIGDGECVTHSFACDCREEGFKKIEATNERYKKALKGIVLEHKRFVEDETDYDAVKVVCKMVEIADTALEAKE